MRNDGGQALIGFEMIDGTVRFTSQLSIRDYFAAHALQGFCIGFCTAFTEDTTLSSELASVYAYKAADAMLKEREKP